MSEAELHENEAAEIVCDENLILAAPLDCATRTPFRKKNGSQERPREPIFIPMNLAPVST